VTDTGKFILKTGAEDQLHYESADKLPQMMQLISQFDTEFIECLTQYKCASRYHEKDIEQKRQVCEMYLDMLETRLNKHAFLISNKESLADIALLPFIRQIARVERQWYLQSPYPKLRAWLNAYLQSPIFTQIMINPPFWVTDQEIIIFGK
jgi:glutathione S-transferase